MLHVSRFMIINMSGHSKWHNIQQKKGKMDSTRGSTFTKLSRAITMASQGGGDPEMNFSLRLAIEKAKEVNMPKDNIERAIKRGTGELDDEAALEEILYESFGPSGTMFLVEAVTNNRNRTVAEIKNIVNNHGGSMGGPGSVKWQFERFGIVRINTEQKNKIADKWSDFELALMDAGVADIIENEYGVELRCPIVNFQKVMEIVNTHKLELDESGLEWVAKESVKLGSEDSEKVQELYDTLDDFDDVKAVYSNS